jgi:hypothetical protein
MNEIRLKGTVFSAKQTGKMTTFRLSFYNGKDKEGNYNPNGFIECKCFENVTFSDKERIEVVGYLACDYWEYQGKKYSQLVIKVSEIIRGEKKEPDRLEKLEEAWNEPQEEETLSDDEIPF